MENEIKETKDSEKFKKGVVKSEDVQYKTRGSNNRKREDKIQQQGMLVTTSHNYKLKEGEFCNTERLFTKNGYFNFSAPNKIESIDDVAYIFNNLQEKSIENLFLVAIKNNEPTIIHLGMGDPRNAICDVSSCVAVNNMLKPDMVYMVHNHPSGSVCASPQDISLHKDLKNIFKNTMQDSIIINTTSGYYGLFNEFSGSNWEGDLKEPRKELYQIPVFTFDKQVFEKDIKFSNLIFDSNIKVAEFISTQRLGKRDKLSYFVFDCSLRIKANLHLNYTNITNENVKEIAQKIANKTVMFGGDKIIVYGNSLDLVEQAHLLKSEINKESGKSLALIDCIRLNTDGSSNKEYISALEENRMFCEPKKEYKVKLPNKTLASIEKRLASSSERTKAKSKSKGVKF